MKNTVFKIGRGLSLLLVLLLVTACGKGAASSSTGLVVVDSGSAYSSGATSADSSGASSGSAAETGPTEESSPDESEEESASSRAESGTDSGEAEPSGRVIYVVEDGQYTSKAEVAAYLHQFGHLPSNYITKTKAKKLGWDSSGKQLWKVAPGMSIGGSHYGNYEGILPEGNYCECDIDFDGKKRGVKRIVYSDDGRIYYTEDHYKTFEQLY